MPITIIGKLANRSSEVQNQELIQQNSEAGEDTVGFGISILEFVDVNPKNSLREHQKINSPKIVGWVTDYCPNPP
jgi:hypothetical protein